MSGKGGLLSVVLFVIAGLILIVWSNTQMSYNGIDIDEILSIVGSVLVVGTIMSYIFENLSKERLFGEIFSQINKDLTIKRSGVEACYAVSSDIVYRDDIAEAMKVTTLFTYADGFIKRHFDELLIAAKRGAEIRFVFVRQDSKVIEAMKSLGWSEASMLANFEAIERYEKLFQQHGNVKFVFVDAIPRYAAVLFDNSGYVIEHTTSCGQRSVPAVKISRSGFLGDFYYRDIEKLILEGK